MSTLSEDNHGEVWLTYNFHVTDAAKSYNAAFLKRQQLEREIRQSTTDTIRDNMLHTLSKLWMFMVDEFVPNEISTAAFKQRKRDK